MPLLLQHRADNNSRFEVLAARQSENKLTVYFDLHSTIPYRTFIMHIPAAQSIPTPLIASS
jgi:hypothetical protein